MVNVFNNTSVPIQQNVHCLSFSSILNVQCTSNVHYIRPLSHFDRTMINFTVIFFSFQMQKLEAKFQVELKDDAEVLACRFPLPNWKPTKVIEEGIDSVWLYQKKYTHNY